MQLTIPQRELKALSNVVYKLSLSKEILNSRRFKASGAIFYHPVYCVEIIVDNFEIHKLIAGLAGHCKHTKNVLFIASNVRC